jgi:sulfide:quinone oxidoreductase
VYAAGDGTAFPIKKGGLATEHADAVAAASAVAAGAPVEAEPFRHGVAGGDGEPDVATHALWWPSSKISGRCASATAWRRPARRMTGNY